MGRLLADGYEEFFPFTGWGEAVEVQEGATVQDRSGRADNPSKAQQGLFIDFVSAHQVGVITEIAEEPAEFPQGLGGAVEPTRQRGTLVLFGFKDSEPQ